VSATKAFAKIKQMREQKRGGSESAEDPQTSRKSENTKPKRQILVIDKGELPQVAEQLRDIIAASGDFFDRGLPVRIIRHPGGKLPTASPLTIHGVVRAAHKLCRPVKDGESVTLPDRVAALYLDMAGEWMLPALVVISTAPILANDGSIRSVEGYDQQSGIHCCEIPQLEVKDHPTHRRRGCTSLCAKRSRLFRSRMPCGNTTRHLRRKSSITLEKYGGDHVQLKRIALVGDLGSLPSFPASDKKKDPRYKWFVERYGNKCWELDAVDPNDLRDRVTEEIVALIEPKAWKRCDKINRAEQESLRTILDKWRGGRQ
jgi:hypothetical protein